MFKYKYFFLPYDESEIGAIEGWLELMADRGLKLTCICLGNLYKFEKSSTSKVRYCIHPQMNDACSDMPGWEYVGKLSLYFKVFISEDNNDIVAPDINPVHIEDALKKQIHRHIEEGILFFLLAVLMIALIIRLHFVFGGFIEVLIYYDVLLLVGILAGFICAVVSVLLQVVAYIKRKKRISLLMEFRKQPVVKTHRIFERCLIAIIIISLIIIRVPLHKARRIQTIPLDKYMLNLKLPLMEQISPNEWYIAETIRGKHSSDISTNYSVTEKSRYVAPKILFVRQYWNVVQDIPDAYEEPFGYNVNYYEMRNTDLAVRYEEELCRSLSYGEMTAIHVDGFDSATHFLKGEVEDIVLRSENIVITAMYYGSGSLLDSVHQFSSVNP